MAVTLPNNVKKSVDELALFATLATILPDGSPHLTIVWFTRDGDDILVSTTAGRQQGKNVRRDPRVAVIISSPDDPYRYIEIRGRAVVTPDPEGKLPDELALKYTGTDYRTFNPASTHDAARLILRVTPEKITGKW